jgi:dynein heavy chain
MKKTHASPKIIKLLKTPNLLESLTRISESLDVIEKQLEDYLEVKRRVFPRFYFLSNDELLEILAKSQNI